MPENPGGIEVRGLAEDMSDRDELLGINAEVVGTVRFEIECPSTDSCKDPIESSISRVIVSFEV